MGSMRAATVGAAVMLLAVVAGCGDRIDSRDLPRQASVQMDRQDTPGAQDARTALGVENRPVPQDAYTHTLGAKGGTSVMDPDVLISEQVKAALASHPQFGRDAGVEVRSKDGEVTLRGRAPDPEAKQRAETIARAIPNVRSVDNQLTPG